jgi:isocitrate dehydrogenase
MNVVIVRENEEDLYCGIEYRQTADVFHAKKIISQLGTEKIIRYAFDYALSNNRKKVSCFTKDNILKLTDGFFHKTFNTIAKEYPQIEHDHFIVDIGSALLADTPEIFDVIVAPNLYGDILSDVAAQITGSIGIGSSANIGDNFALFEAIHGSWPNGACKDIANPSGLLLAAVEMLNYLHLHESALLIHNAWLSTIEEGIHTADLFNKQSSKEKVGTKAFAQAVIDRIGKKPYQLKPSSCKTVASKKSFSIPNTPDRKFVGCDVYVYFSGSALDLQSKASFSDNFTLDLITNRGATFWPDTSHSLNKTDEWRLRFLFTKENYSLDILLDFLKTLQLDVLSLENLYTFNGEKGYSS